jgi:hypothetical protein
VQAHQYKKHWLNYAMPGKTAEGIRSNFFSGVIMMHKYKEFY